MKSYLLKRYDKVTGPFSLKELKGIGLLSSDSVWIEGKSVVWQFADEIKELVSFVSFASALDRVPNAISGNEFYQKMDFRQFEPDGNNKPVTYHHSQKNISRNQEFSPGGFDSKENLEIEKNQEPASLNFTGLSATFTSRQKNPDYLSTILSESEKSETVSNGFRPEPIKVVIADDHTLFREGVKMALSGKKDVKIIGEAENGLQLLHFLKHNVPDVILLDIQMPLMDGITALTTIRKNNSNTKVIMLSMYNDHSMVSTLMQAGANAYLTKTADSEIIYDAIKTCYEKSYYFNELTNISLLEKIRSVKTAEKPIKIKTETPTPFAGRPILANKPYPATAQKSVKQLIVVTCSILVITSGILAGITILNHSDQKLAITRQNYKTRVSEVPLHTQAVHDLNSITPSTIRKLPDNNLPPVSESSMNEIADPEIQKTNPGQFEHTDRKLIPAANIYSTKYVNSKQVSTSEKVDRKEMTRKKLHSLVTVHTNNPHIDANGIISDAGLTVFNQTLYTLDLVIVDIQYRLKDSVVYKKKTLNFIGITPLSSRMISIPKVASGTRIEYRIISVKSRELNL